MVGVMDTEESLGEETGPAADELRKEIELFIICPCSNSVAVLVEESSGVNL